MNGNKTLVRLVAVTVLVTTAVLSTVSGVAAIHLVDPTRAARSSWERFSVINRAQQASETVIKADGVSSWERFELYNEAQGGEGRVAHYGAGASSWDRFVLYTQALEEAELARNDTYVAQSGGSRGLAVMRPVETESSTSSALARFNLYIEAQDRMELERSDTFGGAPTSFTMDSMTRFDIYTWASGAVE